jgi:hypothetical protein
MRYDGDLTIENLDFPAKVEMSANRFELISRWGQPVDKDWARDMFERWLMQRMDLTPPSVYDHGIPSKGVEHDQPRT